MSHHPYSHGYGQYQGPPQPAQQSAQPPNQNYYNQRYSPSTAERNRAASQNSFNYNASQIPGLGIGGQASPGAGYNDAPDSSPWPASAFSPFIPATSAANLASGSFQKAERLSSAPSNTSKPPIQPAIDIEEGELSEGQFEDLYEPKDAEEPTSAQNNPIKSSSAVGPGRIESTAATPEPGFYGNEEDEGEIVTREKRGEGRERSGSYSPFLSPREIQTQNTTPQAVENNVIELSSPFLAASQTVKLKEVSRQQVESTRSDAGQPGSTVPGLQFTPQQASNLPCGNIDEPATTAPLDVATVKKEAQKAILRLWPMGVKYQQYLDEGFDENVIKALFLDLHLDIPKKPTTTTATGSQTAQGVPPADSQKRSGAEDQPSKTGGQRTGEERKDRIARLLAAKAAKTPAVSNAKPAPNQAKAVTAQTQGQHVKKPDTAGKKGKQWGEKERLLQQKIAALQKKRETQGQTSAAEGSSVSEKSTTPNQTARPSSANGEAVASNNQIGVSQIVSIAGVPIPLTAQPGQSSNQRKRPVAADFVEYSSTVGPLKRPFGHNRKETSIIIDVSDGSDDEEMDMDMESPIENYHSSKGLSTQRGPSIRDFPPLTDTPPPRQFSSPVLISTPPNGPANGKRKETELDLKEKAIQEMRRKIAEAEARRNAKKSSSGPQTPHQASSTPESRDNEVLHIPKRPGGQLAHNESGSPRNRRGRIVSLELPRVEESLEEKVKRLNQIREEERRLQSEIDEELARKQMLTEELEQLDAAPSESSSQQNKLTSGTNSESTSQSGTSPPDQQAAPAPAAATNSASSDESEEESDVSMDEDQSSREPSQDPKSSQEVHRQLQQRVSSSTPSSSADKSQDGSDPNGRGFLVGEDPALVLEPSGGPSEAADERHNDVVTAGVLAVDLESAQTVADQHTTVDVSDVHGDTPMELDSPPISPNPIDSTAPQSPMDEDSADSPQSSAQLSERVSNFAQSPEDTFDAEARATREPAVGEAPPNSANSFVPYESPLRYFHAYKYHPGFSFSVAGGLKSLTYSNRIDPRKTLCPHEANRQQCRESCEFQHFDDITMPDDQILLELGRSDDFSGEQKNRFIQGLRGLLQDFRANKVKDFDAIARGIIEYRSRFLGDRSKILNLEGVTI